MRWSRAWALIVLGRPHFLAGGVVLHALGVAMALSTGAPLDFAALAWGQIAITSTQLMTHYANDYFDVAADRENLTPTYWSGGSRVLVDGRLLPRAALTAALVMAGVALAATGVLGLVVRPGAATFALLLLSIALAWFYSAPPLRLLARGLGEASAGILVAGLTPVTGFYLQTGEITRLPLLAAAPLCCLQIAMLLSVNFPDADGDLRVGKRTLVVRIGAAAAARLYVTLVLAPYAILPLLVRAGLPIAPAVAVWALFPLALWLAWRALRGDWREPARWNSLEFFTIALLMVTSAAEALAFGIG